MHGAVKVRVNDMPAYPHLPRRWVRVEKKIASTYSRQPTRIFSAPPFRSNARTQASFDIIQKIFIYNNLY